MPATDPREQRQGYAALVPREMTEAEMREFLLEGTRTAKVATVMADGAPHVMPVWFVLDGDRIVFTTGRGSVKGRNLRRDPRVAIVVEDDTPPFVSVSPERVITLLDAT